MSDLQTTLYGFVKSPQPNDWLAGIEVKSAREGNNGDPGPGGVADGRGRYELQFPRNSGIWMLFFHDPEGVYEDRDAYFSNRNRNVCIGPVNREGMRATQVSCFGS